MQQCREAFDVSLDKLHLIPNAVDVGKFRPAANGTEAPLTVTFVGRLEEWKGPHSFVQIARRVRAEVPEATSKVAGAGPLQPQLMADSRDLDGHISFLGEVGHSRIPDLMRETSVLVLPSFIEGLSTVCLEALACGIPVVASDTGGTSEIIRDGETGYLCPTGDLDRFAGYVCVYCGIPSCGTVSGGMAAPSWSMSTRGLGSPR